MFPDNKEVFNKLSFPFMSSKDKSFLILNAAFVRLLQLLVIYNVTEAIKSDFVDLFFLNCNLCSSFSVVSVPSLYDMLEVLENFHILCKNLFKFTFEDMLVS